MPEAPEYSIAVQPLGGSWGKIGTDYARGVVPESINHASELPGGPSTLTFTLKRDTRVPWPDLTPFTPVYSTLGGLGCFSGRVAQTPTNRGDESSIGVVCEGWWNHLKDDPLDKTWAVADLSKWVDARTYSGMNLAVYTSAYNVTANGQEIVLALPQGSTQPNNTAGAVFFDAGPNNTINRIVCTYIGGGVAGLQLNSYGAATPSTILDSNVEDAAAIATISTTFARTFATPRRYVGLALVNGSGGAVAGADTAWVKITSAQVFTSTAYESANASILKTSTATNGVIQTALTAKAPLFSTDHSLLATTTYSIPEFYTQGYETVADIITRANTFHEYQIRVKPEPTPRLEYRAIPTTPTYVLNESDGYTFQNASANDSTEIYNKAIVRWTSGAGVIADTSVTPTTDNTFPGRRGFTRTKNLQVESFRTDSTGASQIGTAFLDTHQAAPLRGTLSVTGTITRYSDGTRVPVGTLQAGDIILLGNEQDPETGARGRTGAIAQVSYDHDKLTASITLDTRKDFLDAVYARGGMSR